MTDKNIKAEGQESCNQEPRREQPRDSAGLQHRYGTIGIQAVAAAVRYSNPGKAVEPKAAQRIDQRFEQAV